ncbi:Glutathione import ATP-binding protein GsiA [compost metagenome]
MRLGRVVELAEAVRVFDDPQHPYTRKLLGATPSQHPAGRDERRAVRSAFAQAHADGLVPTV